MELMNKELVQTNKFQVRFLSSGKWVNSTSKAYVGLKFREIQTKPGNVIKVYKWERSNGKAREGYIEARNSKTKMMNRFICSGSHDEHFFLRYFEEVKGKTILKKDRFVFVQDHTEDLRPALRDHTGKFITPPARKFTLRPQSKVVDDLSAYDFSKDTLEQTFTGHLAKIDVYAATASNRHIKTIYGQPETIRSIIAGVHETRRNLTPKGCCYTTGILGWLRNRCGGRVGGAYDHLRPNTEGAYCTVSSWPEPRGGSAINSLGQGFGAAVKNAADVPNWSAWKMCCGGSKSSNNTGGNSGNSSGNTNTDTWACSACTFANPASANVCELCFTQKGQQPPPSLTADKLAEFKRQAEQRRNNTSGSDTVPAGQWACSACTTHNPNTSDKCSSCGGAKPDPTDDDRTDAGDGATPSGDKKGFWEKLSTGLKVVLIVGSCCLLAALIGFIACCFMKGSKTPRSSPNGRYARGPRRV